MSKHKDGDILGVRGFGEATKIVAKGAVEGAGAFLGRICLPAAEELGLLLRDKVSAWRAQNAARIALKAERLLEQNTTAPDLQAHPRIVGKVLEHGSWEDDETVQEMWAGLLASACSQDGQDQRNLIFINLLEQMTSSQAKLVQIVCQKAEKFRSPQGYIVAKNLVVSGAEAMEMLGTTDVHDADVQLDHLREIGLIFFGFEPYTDRADLTPTALALHMFARSMGFRGSSIDYFQVPENSPTSPNDETATPSEAPETS